MTTLIFQVLLAILGLSATAFTWWIKNNAEKQKRIDSEDKNIDAIINGDDVTRVADRLRNK